MPHEEQARQVADLPDTESAREWLNEHCTALVRRERSSSEKKGSVHYALEKLLTSGRRYSEEGDLIEPEMNAELASYLYFRSFVCPYTFDIARKVAARKVREGAPMPEMLREFASQVLSGRARRPTQRGRSRLDKWERDRQILQLLDNLVGFYGLTPTRNDVTSPKNSACDLVAAGFAHAGDHTVTYMAVKAIWHNVSLREELRLIRALGQDGTLENPPDFLKRGESPFGVSEN